MVGANAEDRVDEATSASEERRFAEELQKSEVHRYFYCSIFNCNCLESVANIL